MLHHLRIPRYSTLRLPSSFPWLVAPRVTHLPVFISLLLLMLGVATVMFLTLETLPLQVVVPTKVLKMLRACKDTLPNGTSLLLDIQPLRKISARPSHEHILTHGPACEEGEQRKIPISAL